MYVHKSAYFLHFWHIDYTLAWQFPFIFHLEELAEELGIVRKVHFRGFLSQQELLELYGSSHCFLHPSETPPDQNQEGIPNSILEAMSTGLAVLATRHGGIPEAVEEGRSGMLVEERDFEALAAAMKNLVRSPFAFREMGALGSESVAAKKLYGVEDEFILYVGTIEPRKNLISVVKALEKIARETSYSPQMVFAGPRGWLNRVLLTTAGFGGSGSVW